MSARRKYHFLVTTLLITLFSGCAGGPSASPDQATPADDADAPAFIAPDFALPSLTNDTIRLSDLRGQPVVVNFWATYCGPCRAEMPDLQAIADAYSGRVAVLGINHREDEATVRAFIEEVGIKFPILLYPDDDTLIAYQVLGLPQTIIIDPNGDIVFRTFGPIDPDAVRATLDSILTS